MIEPPQTNVIPIIAKAGIKPATNHWHNFLRVIIILAVLVLTVVSSLLQHPKVVKLQDMENIIKPNTTMHRMISEMDPTAQQRYLRTIQKTFEPDESRTSKYLKSIRTALAAGLISEYIVNGNTAKPIGILSKTIIYTTIATLAAL